MDDLHANICFMNNKIKHLSLQNQTHLINKIYCFNHSHTFISFFLLLLFLLTSSSPATAQFVEAQHLDPNTNNKSSVFAIMAIVIIMFFVSGFISVFSRQCSGGRNRTLSRINLALPTIGDNNGRSRRHEPRGLDQEIIDTFPTFLYSNVKGLKIGKETLVCAVCINEFQDDETLRLIPKCNHVFHPSCIDVWLSSHSTCPVCRANLVPRPEDTPPVVSIQIPDEEANVIIIEEEEEIVKREINDTESSKEVLLKRSHTLSNHNRLPRSRSTDFLYNVLFPRCNSTGHHSGEDFEMFTLRLPNKEGIKRDNNDDVESSSSPKVDHSRSSSSPRSKFEKYTLRLPDEVLNTAMMKRTKSCVSFRRMSSGRKGYRTRSFSSGGSEEQGRFSLMMPYFISMNNWNRLGRKLHSQGTTRVVLDDDDNNNNVGERSSDLLCPK